MVHILGKDGKAEQVSEAKKIVRGDWLQQHEERISNLEQALATFDQVLRQAYMQLNQQVNITISIAKLLEKHLGIRLVDLVDKDGNPLPELPGDINIPKIVGEVHSIPAESENNSLQVRDESAPPPPPARSTSTLSPEGCVEEDSDVCSCEGECHCAEGCEKCSKAAKEDDAAAVDNVLKDLGYI